MKIIKIGKTRKYFQIADQGQDEKTADWYTVSDNLLQYTKDMKEGDEVSIKFETRPGYNGSITNFLTYIVKGSQSVPINTSTTHSGAQKSYGYDKSSEVQDSIKRQATAHATSRVLIALQGHVTPDNFEVLSTKVYNHILKLINNE